MMGVIFEKTTEGKVYDITPLTRTVGVFECPYCSDQSWESKKFSSHRDQCVANDHSLEHLSTEDCWMSLPGSLYTTCLQKCSFCQDYSHNNSKVLEAHTKACEERWRKSKAGDVVRAYEEESGEKFVVWPMSIVDDRRRKEFDEIQASVLEDMESQKEAVTNNEASASSSMIVVTSEERSQKEAITSNNTSASSSMTEVTSQEDEKLDVTVVPICEKIRVIDIHLVANQGDNKKSDLKDFGSFWQIPEAGASGDVAADTEKEAKCNKLNEKVTSENKEEYCTTTCAKKWARESIAATHIAFCWQARVLRNERSGVQEEAVTMKDKMVTWDVTERKEILKEMNSLSNYLDSDTLGFKRVDTLEPSKPIHTDSRTISEDLELFMLRKSGIMCQLNEVSGESSVEYASVLQRYIEDMRAAAKYVDQRRTKAVVIDEVKNTDVKSLARFDFPDLVRNNSFYHSSLEIDPPHPDPDNTIVAQHVAVDRLDGLPPFYWRTSTNEPYWVTDSVWSCGGKLDGLGRRHVAGYHQLQLVMDHYPPSGRMKMRALGTHWDIKVCFEMDQRRPDAERIEKESPEVSEKMKKLFEVIVTTTMASPAVVLGVLYLEEKPLCGTYVLEKRGKQTRCMVDTYRPSVKNGRAEKTDLIMAASWTEAMDRYAISHSALDIDAVNPPMSLIGHVCKDGLCGEEHEKKFWIDPLGQCYDLGCLIWPLRSVLMTCTKPNRTALARISMERLPEFGLVTLIAVGHEWETFGYLMPNNLLHDRTMGKPRQTVPGHYENAAYGKLYSSQLIPARLFGRLQFSKRPLPGPYVIKSGKYAARARVDPIPSDGDLE